MLAHLLALASGPHATRPSLGGLEITRDLGTCTGPHVLGTAATVTAVWTVAHPDDSAYDVQVSVNGAAPVTLSTMSTTSYSHTPNVGRIEGGINQTSITTSFEVRLVRKLDAAILEVRTGSYTGSYGVCP